MDTNKKKGAIIFRQCKRSNTAIMFKRRYTLMLVRHSSKWQLSMPYRSKFRLFSKQEGIAEWRESFESVNTCSFFPLKTWPQEYQRMFWEKPIGHQETFKLMLFCLGNGCAPQLTTPDWIIFSQSWLPTSRQKNVHGIWTLF